MTEDDVPFRSFSPVIVNYSSGIIKFHLHDFLMKLLQGQKEVADSHNTILSNWKRVAVDNHAMIRVAPLALAGSVSERAVWKGEGASESWTLTLTMNFASTKWEMTCLHRQRVIEDWQEPKGVLDYALF